MSPDPLGPHPNLPLTISEQAGPGWKGNKGAALTWLWSCRDKMTGRGVGHQIPTDLRVENAQLKCTCSEPSLGLSTEPPLSISTAAAHSLSSWSRNVGSWPSLTAPETLLCLSTLPLFKNKTKGPTPPSALQHHSTGEGQALPGGCSISQWGEAGLREESQ